METTDDNSKEHSKLLTPKIELKRPPSGGAGLKKAGLLVFGISVLFSFFWNAGPQNNYSTVTLADAVIDLTKSQTQEKTTLKDAQNSSSRNISTKNFSGIELNGVTFFVVLPQNWTGEISGNQIFFRRSEDNRLCQITSNALFDAKGFKSQAIGNEVNLEVQLIKKLLKVGSGGVAQVAANGKLLFSKVSSTTYNYAVQLKTSMSFKEKKVNQLAIIATFIAADNMVRLQCMNMGGLSDDDKEMERIASSLALK